MSNIKKAFENGKAFIAFITCGDPNLETTAAAVRAAAGNGADLIELGIPLKSLTDHKTNRGSLNLKELLISGRDTALANIRRAEDSLMRINSCIDEITEQEILRHKDAPYTRFLAKRHIFISPWKENSQ